MIGLALPTALLAQEENNYSITGEVKDEGIKEVYISYLSGHGVQTDSAKVINRVYSLTGRIPAGMVVSLSTVGPDDLPTPDRLAAVFAWPGLFGSVGHRFSG